MGVLLEVMDRIAGGEISSMREAVDEYGTRLAQEVDTNEMLVERLAELELALDDSGWQKLGSDSDKQFTRAALKTINKTARLYWLKNPLIKRAVYTQTAYVFGQGMEINAVDDTVSEVVDAFINDQKNQTELTSHQARMMKETELQLLGNIFFVFFVNEYDGTVRVRTIPEDEIERVITNPEDSKEPRYYLRVWRYADSVGSMNTKEKRMLYPDYRYNPKDVAEYVVIDGQSVPVAREQVYHIKVNCLSDMDFGVSELYAAIDWAKAYKEFLEDWATLVKALSKFAWRAVSKTGKKGVDAIKSRLDSTISSGDLVDRNNPPAVGSFLITGQGTDISPINKTGTTTSVDDGRRMLLMVSAATGIFEHYFGDPSTGNLATAQSMERPMELMFKDRQTLWADVYIDILQYVIDQSIMAPSGRINGSTRYNIYGEREVVIGDNEDGEPIDRTVEITFPDILEKDIASKVEAIVNAATLAGNQPAGTFDMPTVTRMLATALGIHDIEPMISRLFPDGEDVPAAPDSGGAQDESSDRRILPTDGFLESIRKLDEQLAQMVDADDLDEGHNNNPTGINQYSKGRGGGKVSVSDFKAGNDGLVRDRKGRVAGKVTKVKADWGDGYVASMVGSPRHKAYTSKPHPNRQAAVKDVAQRAISQGW